MRSAGRLKLFVVTITLSHLRATRGEGTDSRRRSGSGGDEATLPHEERLHRQTPLP
ncbi:hypothetical protein HMPREF1549_02021 [Actinomyces johnsonii F0510]|uniref:Uncharacterized protein n=1 Tax=Actinomyces johnsonii F0510 TaxID=1227262 RepID=U1PPR2_9ACTO|nr:hypothetical protein HMPREF1549_02021 [Actinomyces johnsonii F0510]